MNYQNIQIWGVVFSVSLLALTFWFMKRRWLQEKYALVWILVMFVILFVSLRSSVLWLMVTILGIETPSNALYLMALAGLVIISYSFSIIHSRQSQFYRRMAQEIALMKFEIERNQNPMKEAEKGNSRER